MENKNRKKKSSLGGIIGTIVLLLLSIAGNGDGIMAMAIIILIVVAAIMFFVGKKIADAAGNIPQPFEKAKSIFTSSAWNSDVPPEDEVFVARSPEIRSYDENAAERNFNRDKERRIRQLEVFLKNGIIEKDEYRFLRDRYERS